jgi:hypothetical protein
MGNRKLYKTNNQPFFVNTEAAFVILFCRENEEKVASDLFTCFNCNSFDLAEFNPFEVTRIPKYSFPLSYIQTETDRVLLANTCFYFN